MHRRKTQLYLCLLTRQPTSISTCSYSNFTESFFQLNFPNELFIQTLNQSIWWSSCLHAPLHAIIKIRQRGEKVIDYLGYFLVLFASSEAKNNNICNLKAISQHWIFPPLLLKARKNNNLPHVLACYSFNGFFQVCDGQYKKSQQLEFSSM